MSSKSSSSRHHRFRWIHFLSWRWDPHAIIKVWFALLEDHLAIPNTIPRSLSSVPDATQATRTSKACHVQLSCTSIYISHLLSSDLHIQFNTDVIRTDNHTTVFLIRKLGTNTDMICMYFIKRDSSGRNNSTQPTHQERIPTKTMPFIRLDNILRQIVRLRQTWRHFPLCLFCRRPLRLLLLAVLFRISSLSKTVGILYLLLSSVVPSFCGGVPLTSNFSPSYSSPTIDLFLICWSSTSVNRSLVCARHSRDNPGSPQSWESWSSFRLMKLLECVEIMRATDCGGNSHCETTISNGSLLSPDSELFGLCPGLEQTLPMLDRCPFPCSYVAVA